MIEAQAVSKRFRSLVALDEVSFRCEDGEIVGLLGPNGAGKTTLLRVLCTTLKPTSGTALVDGLDVRKDGAGVRARVGLLVEGAGLYERLTPREHLWFWGQLQGLDGKRLGERVPAVLEQLGMTEFADRRAAGFSAGMARRVALAQALIHDPRNLMLDEPSAGLDVTTARDVRGLVERLRDEGRCILVCTHLMQEAERLCDRVAIIHKGRVLAIDAPAALMAQAGVDTLEDAFVSIVGEERLWVDLREEQAKRWPWRRRDRRTGE